MTWVRHEAAVLVLAVQFLTRLPVASDHLWSEARQAATPRYFPLVGAAIGAVLALALWALCMALPQPVSVLLTLTLGLLLTGGFHEDGLADTFDGIGGSTTRERALEIMRDSRLGTYGTLALILALLLKAATLSLLPLTVAAATLIAAHCLSRLSAVWVMATSTYVRDEGTGKPTARGIALPGLLFATACGAAVLGGLAWISLPAALAMLVGTAIGHLAMRSLFERKLGGYTGDTLGAVQQASELGAIIGVLAWH